MQVIFTDRKYESDQWFPRDERKITKVDKKTFKRCGYVIVIVIVLRVLCCVHVRH